MARPAANPTFLRRVANVTIVALCTASSLALLGAVRADSDTRPSGSPTVVVEQPKVIKFEETQVPEASEAISADAEQELLVTDDSDDAVLAAVTTRVMRMEVTAYCPCTKCCGSNAQGITASGKLVDYNGGKFVAADTRLLPFGKKLVVPGYADGAPVEVIDRGGAIKGNKLDLYFPTHEEALIWGRQMLDVTVFE